MSDIISKLIETLNNELGYLEKAGNSQLDDKTANAGNRNYTKYARDMANYGIYNVQGCAWCDCFADWVMVQTVGIKKAHELLGGWSAYTPTSAGFYKKMNRWFTTPQVGDQIFFKNASRICHTGWVVGVSSTTVTTIEGNTSGASGVISNGGGVCRKSYKLSNPRIAGYGRPDWASVSTPSPVTLSFYMNIPQCFSQNIKDLQRALNGDGLHDSDNQPLSEDGIFGSKTYQALCRVCLSTKTIRRFINVTAWVQCRTGTTADGLFGQNTRAAVIRYQSSKGLSADGIVGINTLLQLVRDYV